MRTLTVALLALVATVLARPSVAVATTAADICDPMAETCELATEVTVSPGSTLDFGTRAFVLRAPDGRLQVGTGDTLSITAASMLIETGPGGRLRSAPGSDGGCGIDIRVTGTFAVTRVAGASSIAVDLSSSAEPCVLEVRADGDVNLGAEIQARGIGTDSGGGEVFLRSGGRVTIADRILADSPVLGGTVEVDATGPIEVTDAGAIDVSDAFGFGSIVLTTAADLVTAGRLDVKGRPNDVFGCDGGFVILSALGDIVVNGPISGTGATLPNAGCLGGTLNMLASRDILVNAPIDFSGGPDGQGGILEEIGAGRDFLQSASILVGGPGLFGVGGDVDIVAGRRLHVGALLDVAGGPGVDLDQGFKGGGGFVRLTAAETLEITGEVAADGADFGELVFTTAPADSTDIPGRITITGEIHALASADEDLSADARFEACDIEIAEGGSVIRTGPASRNLLRASGIMTIGGTLDAGAGTNELHHRDPAKPPRLLSTAEINPAASITATPDEPLRPCACTLDPGAAGLHCDDANACTQDLCDPNLGCRYTPLAGEGVGGCDDGNVCNGRESCTALVCGPGAVPAADDGDPCTDDGACDPVSGYPRTPKTGFGAATCRMERIENALATASVPGDASARSLRQVRKLARGVRKIVQHAAKASRKRRTQLLRAATRKLRRLDTLLASPRTSLSPKLAQLITTESTAIRATLTQLQSG